MCYNQDEMQSVHLGNNLLDSMIECVLNGHRQGNHLEMIDFFKYATYFAHKDEL